MQYTLHFIEVFIADLGHAGPILLFLIGVISLLGLTISRIEGWSAIDGIYHAFINATTVGYGDIRPTTTSAKLLSIALALTGIVFTGLIVALALHSAALAFDEVYHPERPLI